MGGGDLVGPHHHGVSLILVVGDDLLGDGDDGVGLLQTVVQQRGFAVLDHVPWLSLILEGHDVGDGGKDHIDLRGGGDGGEVESLLGLTRLESVLRGHGGGSDGDGRGGGHVGDDHGLDVSSGDGGLVGSLGPVFLVDGFLTFHQSGDGQVLDVIVEPGERRVLDSDGDGLRHVEHNSVGLGDSSLNGFDRVSDLSSRVVFDELLESGGGVIFVEDQDGGSIRGSEFSGDDLGVGLAINGVGQLGGLLFRQIRGSGSSVEFGGLDSSVIGGLVDDHIVRSRQLPRGSL